MVCQECMPPETSPRDSTMRYTTVPNVNDTPKRDAAPAVTLPQPNMTIMAVPRASAMHSRVREGNSVARDGEDESATLDSIRISGISGVSELTKSASFIQLYQVRCQARARVTLSGAVLVSSAMSRARRQCLEAATHTTG